MDNIGVCKRINKEIVKNINDIVEVGIEIKKQTATNVGKDEKEINIYTGIVTGTTKTQIYTGEFIAKTYYEPLIQTKWFKLDGIYKERMDLDIEWQVRLK